MKRRSAKMLGLLMTAVMLASMLGACSGKAQGDVKSPEAAGQEPEAAKPEKEGTVKIGVSLPPAGGKVGTGPGQYGGEGSGTGSGAYRPVCKRR